MNNIQIDEFYDMGIRKMTLTKDAFELLVTTLEPIASLTTDPLGKFPMPTEIRGMNYHGIIIDKEKE